MSIELSLNESKLKQEGWEELLQKACAERGCFREPEFREGAATVLFPGSIRGVSVNLEPEGKVQMRLSAFASRADWRAAFDLMREAISRGGGSLDKDGEPLSAEDLTDDRAEALCIDDFRFSSHTIRRMADEGESGEFSLPIEYFKVKAASTDIPDPQAWSEESFTAAETFLAGKTERFGSAFPASIMHLKKEYGEATLSNYHHEPTLFSKKVGYLAFEGTTRSLKGAVPREKVEEILKDYLEDAGELWYLPAIDFHKESELFDGLSAAVAFGGEKGGEESGDEGAAAGLEASAFKILTMYAEGKANPASMITFIANSDSKDDAKVVIAVTEALKALKEDEKLASDWSKLLDRLVSSGSPKDVATAVVKVLFSRRDELAAKTAAGGQKEEKPSPPTQKGGGCTSALVILAVVLSLISCFS